MFPQADCVQRQALTTVEELLGRGCSCGPRFTLLGLWSLLSLPFGCFIAEPVGRSSGMDFDGPKLATSVLIPESIVWILVQAKVSATCAFSGATWYELRSDLQMVAPCVRLKVPERG